MPTITNNPKLWKKDEIHQSQNFYILLTFFSN